MMMTDKHGFGGADQMGLQSMRRCTLFMCCNHPKFKRVSDAGEGYVAETQRAAIGQDLVVTRGLKKLFKDTQSTVEQLSFVTGHKSVSASV